MQDVPAEFLPALPANRQRASVGVRDARVESMMAHMQQRPISQRSDSESNRRGSYDPSAPPRRPSIDMNSRPANDRPLSIRSAASERSRPDGVPIAQVERPASVSSIPRLEFRSASDASRVSASSGQNRVAPEDLPVAVAEIEPADDERSLKSNGGLPPIARTFVNEAGNRSTLTMSDEELARRLHVQLNGLGSSGDGQIVTAEIVQHEMADRRQAEMLLDQEISNLENAVMARQLSSHNLNDAGMAEDDAFRTALLNDKLDYMRPESHKPKFSLLIFVTCVVTLCAEIGVNGGIEPFSTNPTFGPKPQVLLQMGAKRADLILAGQYYRLIAPMILHAGILHLLFNMLGLYNIGVPMEREFGTWRIAAIFILSGMFGILLSCLFAPTLTSVGASGAIFGLFGAAWADLIQNWSLYKGSQIRMLLQLFLMTAFNIVLGLMPFLDNFTHIGGLICGCILGLGVLVQNRYYYSGLKKRKRTYQILLMILSMIALPGIFVAGYVVFFTRTPINCSWCVYISCVPMPPNVPYDQRWWNCDACSQSQLTGQVDPTNNTLIFNCPNTNVQVSESYPPSTQINQQVLIDACAHLCLGQ